MFGAFRRCPATLSRQLSSAAIASRTLRTPVHQSNTAFRYPIQTARLANISSAGFHNTAKWQQVQTAPVDAEADAKEEATKPSEDELITNFKDLATKGLVHPNIVKTITDKMRLTTMTDVQTRTINEALSGVDM